MWKNVYLALSAFAGSEASARNAHYHKFSAVASMITGVAMKAAISYIALRKNQFKHCNIESEVLSEHTAMN